MHLSLIALHSARNDPSGGRRPAQIPQFDTPQASKESHTRYIIVYRVSRNDVRVRILICATWQKPYRKRVYRMDKLRLLLTTLPQNANMHNCTFTYMRYFCLLRQRICPEAMCFREYQSAAVRCLLTNISCDAIFLYLVDRLECKLAQIFIK